MTDRTNNTYHDLFVSRYYYYYIIVAIVVFVVDKKNSTHSHIK